MLANSSLVKNLSCYQPVQYELINIPKRTDFNLRAQCSIQRRKQRCVKQEDDNLAQTQVENALSTVLEA